MQTRENMRFEPSHRSRTNSYDGMRWLSGLLWSKMSCPLLNC